MHPYFIKTTLCFFAVLFFAKAIAQPKSNYDSAWKKVDQYINKGLPKSALEEINKIYAQAKKNDQQAQLIKALIYKEELSEGVTEDSWQKTLQELTAETATAKTPAKQILQSITADLYANYFQQYRYKIYGRSNTILYKKDDPETWSATDFQNKMAALYLASLQTPNLLQQFSLSNYEPIITKGNSRKLRPTLFDLLAHKALDYFENDETGITQPIYAFKLTDTAALADATQFINHPFKSRDSSSHLLMVIKIYQRLLDFHKSDASPAAFLDVDIKRIALMYQKAAMPQKDALYQRVLEHMFYQNYSYPEAMQAGYLLASFTKEKGMAYQPGIGTEADKKAIGKALEICKQAIALFPKSEGGINANNLLKEIEKPSLALQVEKVNVADKPFRILVGFKNFSQINFRIIELTEATENKIQPNDYYNDEYWQRLNQLPVEKNWQQKLPSIKDYRQHSVELKVDALPIGKYAIFASAASNFELNKNPLAIAFFTVSNISYVQNGSSVYVLDRDNGLPLPNAKVQLWKSTYDYSTRKNKRIKGELTNTDKNGFAQLKKQKDYIASQLEITYKNDKLFLDDNLYLADARSFYNEMPTEVHPALPSETEENAYERKNKSFFFFTDRSIYRPGQLVYFKLLGITKDFYTKKSKILQQADSVYVQLTNTNGQKVESLQLKLSEYGTAFSQFRLPENVLNGTFTLSSNYGSHSFNVEEYKRPKFYVSFEKIKGSYKLGETIKMQGAAKAYAGSNIDGATVKYRVQRSTHFLYPWLLWQKGIWNNYAQATTEITNGETTTLPDGKFTIVFDALPDISVDKSLEPAFDYTITADITDLNGETRTATTHLRIANKALQLSIANAGGSTLAVDSFKTINIVATNMSGEAEPTMVAVKIAKLIPTNRLLRNRLWPAPDTTAMSKADFEINFPNDPYKNEGDYRNWEMGTIVQTDSINTASINTLNLLKSTYNSGWYVVEAVAKDKYGMEVKTVEYFQLYDAQSNKLPSPQYNWQVVAKAGGEPGDVASFVAGTSADFLWVVQEVSKPEIVEHTPNTATQILNITNPIATNNFSITEADRGGYTINRFFVKHNRFYTVNWQVVAPWTNKMLDISFETFRDKLLPGQNEKWKMKITGYKGEKLATEMLASMYDASLDAIKYHSWNDLNIWPSFYNNSSWNASQCFATSNAAVRNLPFDGNAYFDKSYDQLLTIQANQYRSDGGYIGTVKSFSSNEISPSKLESYDKVYTSVTRGKLSKEKKDEEFTDGVLQSEKENLQGQQPEDLSAVKVRTNFSETAFFLPNLHTDTAGNIEFSFTMPEALTKWKLQTFAHTKALASGVATQYAITQKDIMVQPNAPRFFRQGDKMVLSAKITNLTPAELSGKTLLQLMDATTGNAVDIEFKNSTTQQSFKVAAGQSVSVAFPIQIPNNFNGALSYRIVAKAGQISDGEENAAPVLSNRMLVTESLPLNMRNSTDKNFVFDKLLQSAAANPNAQAETDEGKHTLTHQSLTIEYTSNPVWYAVQALPYLMEYPYECAEQTFSRFFANALAAKIANSLPSIKAVFTKWATQDTAALISNLEKNQELKNALLQETPWVLDAQNENQQKKNIALLFDLVKMSNEAKKAMGKLKEMQTTNGGFRWFKGGPDDRYITQYILTSMGHLRKLEAWPANQKEELMTIAQKAIPYLDARLKEDYDNLLKYKVKLTQNNLNAMAIQYLYMRSFFTNITIAPTAKIAYDYYVNQCKKYWLQNGKYEQGMIALALNRAGETKIATAIIASLKENSLLSDEFGRYWKVFNNGGYYWYQAPIESHALLIEAFAEIDKNEATINDLKTWLLKQKQTQNWHTTKATAEALYALLLQGTNWLNEEKKVSIQLGNYTLSNTDENLKAEAGTGYIKQRIDGKNVNPNMGNIHIKVEPLHAVSNAVSSSTSWGAVYWQYFENLDKISNAATPLSLTKKLFVEKNTDRGPVLSPINDGDTIKIGDKIKARIELRSDRNMEYVHMKDMRAACMEPTNVLSTYKYQDGLGYYESTKDASTHFFFSYVIKGTYVFEYPMVVTNSGNFSNGITTIQCMYAPEFSSHSNGVRVVVR